MDSCTKLMVLMVVFMVAGVVVICGHAIYLDDPDYNDWTTPQPETPKGGYPFETLFNTVGNWIGDLFR
ncbi:hypothetical protein V1264_005507 [Littorina saxatilis]|uniref:Uncharacterized protein n=1 Tax=Littorina saxatilis TaxID=31220 RepID=A0AAN9AZN2_9CAEN